MPDQKKRFKKPMRKLTPRKIVLIVYDLVSTLAAIVLAGLIFYSGELSAQSLENFKSSWFLFPIVGFIVFYFLGFYDQMWAYASVPQYLLVGAGCLLQTILMVFILQITGWRFHYVVYVIYWFLLMMALLFIRIVHRMYEFRQIKRIQDRKGVSSDKHIRVLIVGAGNAGYQVINELKNRQVLRQPIAIVDDNPLTHTYKNLGVPVLGDRHDIPDIVKAYNIDEIILAMPNASKERIRQTLEICQQTKAKVRTVPFLPEVLSGKVQLSDIKEVEIEDLLGREPVELNVDEIANYIRGKAVLVTGGGGSIGSELARQIATFRPAVLILFDMYENNVYDLQQELKAQYGSRLNLKVQIGSVRDRERLRQIFETWHPSVVFHAAAHKHVPLMEDSPCDAVKNNIFGTWNVADEAGINGADRFVLISTDKAVNPTNVMGSTKRFAEMGILAAASSHPKTRYAAVRFGNVLGSSGSVIPLFRRQIREEHRVTVTHPDIVRYFMTIPEAARLVLQAAAFAQGGEIFVLDMGEPVKIVDLARDLIRLSGFEPDTEIPIEFIGLRPGEKMYEELFLDQETLDATTHKKIFTLHQVHTRDALVAEAKRLHKIIGCESKAFDLWTAETIDLIVNGHPEDN